MCGIAGYVARQPGPVLFEVVQRMNDAMHHRGPDDAGVNVIETDGIGVALGTCRLAIQDLTAAGHQPMQDPITGNWVAFNGEIYNFHELRLTLEASGCRFRTRTDTEVLLQAYGKWGLEPTLQRLRGMFAFAIWDANRHELVLARDRLGVKPLYFVQLPAGFAFASEVRALLAGGVVAPRLSLPGLAAYLQLGAVQDPLTLVEGIQALPPGSLARLSADGFTVTPYWDLLACFRQERSGLSRARILEELRAHLNEAVQLRLISDAPVGVFLSGGLDSTSVVALASSKCTKDLRSVSVVFEENDFSEELYIREVSERFHTLHTQIEMTSGDLLRMLPDALSSMDQPTFDGVNTFVVAGVAKAAGLTVALSGVGGDELFGGYPSFRRVPRLQAMTRGVPGPVRQGLARLAPLVRDDDQVRKLVRWLAQQDLEGGAHTLLRELFGPSDRAHLVPDSDASAFLRVSDVDGLDEFNRVSYFEFSHYLRNVLLRDTDVMGMAHSLEIREPFLDHRLIEYVVGLPGPTKATGMQPKPLLVDALRPIIPHHVRHRRKMGFTFPFSRWLHGALRKPVEMALCDPHFGGQVADALDVSAVEAVWQRFLDHKGTWVRPWALYTLKCWGEAHLA